MFRLLKALFLCLYLSFFLPHFAAAQEPAAIDFDEDKLLVNLRQEYEKYWDDVDFFDHSYPGDAIEEDFIDEIMARHPEYKIENSALRENLLRKTIKIRRIYKKIKKKVLDYILKQDVPLIVPDDQYESGKPEKYRQPEKEGEAVIIKDFKKVIAYSHNPREQEAFAAKLAHDAGLPDASETQAQMKKALLERDWKTLLTYGLFDGKEVLDDMRGLGAWQGEKGGFRARIVNSLKVVNNQNNVLGAFQISIPREHFVLLRGAAGYKPLQIELTGIENLENFRLNFPLPHRFYLGEKNLAGYVGIITVLFQAEVIDTSRPFHLSARVSADVCRDKSCRLTILEPLLTVAAGTEKNADSSVGSFLRLMTPFYPKTQSKDIRIASFEAEAPSAAEPVQIARLEIETEETPTKVDAFILNEPADAFSAPLIRLDGNRIVLRFRSIKAGTDYIGKEFDLLLASSPEVLLRQKVVLEPPSLLSSENPRLNLAMLWFAFLGGLLLNFMPCVFPVLSLKILSFTRFGAVKLEKIRHDFIFTIIGIFSAFALLGMMLITLKYLGRAVGWGMQFQSIGFISFMVFVITLFLAQVMGLVNLRTPDFILRLDNNRYRGEKTMPFLNGMFLVLLSTPCTAPYLGTALGFALAGTASDIAIILSFIGIGLALPYILIAVYPGAAYYVPRPGRWMLWVKAIIIIMLLLTLVWLISLLAAQCGGGMIWRSALCVFFVWLVLFIRKVLIEELERQVQDPETFLQIRRIFNLLALFLLLLTIGMGIYSARSAAAAKEPAQTSIARQNIDRGRIDALVKEGNIVLLKIGADWCLTCHYNDFMLFETPNINDLFERYHVVPIEVDWSSYNPQVLSFMTRYGRRGLPFYVLFSPRVPDGQVLPEILYERQFEEILKNLTY